MKRKEVYYSYLLNKEKRLLRSLGDYLQVDLSKSKKIAKKLRRDDCYDDANKPGPLVKITLEVVKE